MTISNVRKIIVAGNVIIHSKNYDVLWHGKHDKIPKRFDDFTVVDIDINYKYNLSRVCVETQTDV